MKRIIVLILACSVIAAAQTLPQLKVDDLKRMLGDRDILIEQQSQQIAQLQAEAAAWRQQLDVCKKPKEESEK